MRCLFLFFFSSRRRHTRLQGDWSSDVCSSDLVELAYTTSQRSLALRVVDQCIAIHGSDPAQWRVGNEFDELTSAGARSEERRVGKECGDRVRTYGKSSDCGTIGSVIVAWDASK